MATPSIYLVDPLCPVSRISHHRSVYLYLESIMGSSNIFIPNPRFSIQPERDSLVGVFNRARIFLYLVKYSVKYCTKYRKSFAGKTIFFPHTDWVSAACFLLARKIGLINAVFVFRNIGILDNSTMSNYGRLMARFICMKTLRSSDRISSETRALQQFTFQFLSSKFEVSHTPFPGFLLCQSVTKVEDSGEYLFIGVPREDKGYREVITKAKSFPDIRFRIQAPSSGEIDLVKEIELHYPIDNVTFFEQPNSDQEILVEISKARAVLLPYNKKIFTLRGSGILTACLILNKPVIAHGETSLEFETFGNAPFLDWSNFTRPELKSLFEQTMIKPNYSRYVTLQWMDLLK